VDAVFFVVTAVVPLGVVLTEAVGVALGWEAPVLTAVEWVERAVPVADLSACDGMACPECVVPLVSDTVTWFPEPVGEGADVAGARPGTPGTGSSAAGGMGPPANPIPSRQAYPHKAAITAIVSRRQFFRRWPEPSTNTGEDGAGFAPRPAPSAPSSSSGSGTLRAGAGVVDICTASDGPYCAVPCRWLGAGTSWTGFRRLGLDRLFDAPVKKRRGSGFWRYTFCATLQWRASRRQS